MSTETREPRKVQIVFNGDQQVKILGLGLVVGYRADERDTPNTNNVPSDVDKQTGGLEHLRAHWC